MFVASIDFLSTFLNLTFSETYGLNETSTLSASAGHQSGTVMSIQNGDIPTSFMVSVYWFSF